MKLQKIVIHEIKKETGANHPVAVLSKELIQINGLKIKIGKCFYLLGLLKV